MSLVAHYRMFDGTDSSGNGYAGTPTNGLAFVAGKIGNCGSFDGDNDFNELGSIANTDSLALVGSPFTILAWLNPVFTGSDQWMRIVDKSDGGNAQRGYAFYLDNNGNLQVSVGDADGVGGNNWYNNTGEFSAGAWQHAAVVSNGSSYQLYRNATAISGIMGVGSYQQPPNYTTNMRIGSWNHSTGREYKGLMDDVRIYDEALPLWKIKAIYNLGNGTEAQAWLSCQTKSGTARIMGVAAS